MLRRHRHESAEVGEVFTLPILMVVPGTILGTAGGGERSVRATASKRVDDTCF